MTILPLIPARGGSAGVPRKNIRHLPDGSTLLSRAIACAKHAIGTPVVSTDDAEIAREADQFGALVIMRQQSGDGPMLDVVREAVSLFPSALLVALLQPTSPFRSAAFVRDAVTMMESPHTAVVSISPVPAKHSLAWRLRVVNGRLMTEDGDWSTLPTSRQHIQPNEWTRDGCLYLTRAATIRAGSLYGDRVLPIFTPENERLNVDTADDWAVLEARLR